MLYWKHIMGTFFFYSYDQEGFFFGNSHVLDGLLSYRKGWFIYTPIMAHCPNWLVCSQHRFKTLKINAVLLLLIPFVICCLQLVVLVVRRKLMEAE